MTNDEKLVIDNLVSMSKSLSKIATELATIRELLIVDRREKIKESKKTEPGNSKVLVETGKSNGKASGFDRAEIPKTSAGAMSIIKRIRQGSFL